MVTALLLANLFSFFTNCLNSNYVNEIYIDEVQVFWATTGGVVEFNVLDSVYIKYDNTDGLIDNFIFDVVKDNEGNRLFLHPTHGLTKFTPDGSFVPLSLTDLGFPVDTLTCLLADENRVVVASNAGFGFIRGRDTLFFDSDNSGLVNSSINVVKIYDDTLWFGTNGGISKVHVEQLPAVDQWSSFTIQDGLPSNRILDIAPSPDYIWIATDSGVARFDGANWNIVNDGLPSERVRRLVSGSAGIYAGTDRGVAEWTSGHWEPRNEGLAITDVRAMSYDSNDNLWIGTYGGGVGRLDGTWRVYRSPGPTSSFINDVFVDRDGTVWCTHFEPWNPEPIKPNAISRLQDGEWTVYTRNDFGYMGNFRFGAVDRDGNRWFTCYGYGLVKYSSADSFMIYNESNSGLRDNNASYPLVDKYNNRFFSVYVTGGVGEGVSILLADDSTWGFISRDNYTDAVWAMAIDSTYKLWLGSEMSPIITRVDLSISLTNPPDEAWWSYSSGAIPTYAVSVDRDNCVWIGTSNGIRVIRDTTVVKSYTRRDSPLLSDEIMDIEFDLEGNAIIATRNGLNLLRVNGQWESYQTQDGLPSNRLRAVAINQRTGEIWIGSDNGLSRYDSGIFPDSTLEECYTFPNPFVLSRHSYLVFRNTPTDATVRIYTLSGSLIHELSGNRWDGRDRSGRKVSSGVYVYSISTRTGKKIGKLAVIQ